METPPPDIEVLEDQLPALQADPGILQSADLIIWSDDENNRISKPPARIASRIYSNRRRSSAASSRRNSLSSTHSHHSSSSYRNRSTGCQSNHVAQHLRRASIIETRKARLADKAAHAEQVRLRAAQAKAAPRTSVNSEEKALAAQQAREKYLAKVAAGCAEEVNRAKRVAEEMKERKAAEEKRYRQELAEKHAGAEKRRSEILRTPRKTRTTGLMHADMKKPVYIPAKAITQEVAVVRLQRAWRRLRTQRIVKTFNDLGLSAGRVREIDFTEASELLAFEGIITCTSKVMSLLGLGVASANDNTAVRTFLSAFMILGHSTDIFSKNGEQEQDLIDKARGLLISFEALMSDLSTRNRSKPDATQLQTLSQAYNAYLTAFAAWKSHDATVLIETMIDQFVALDAIWQTVKDDTRGDTAADFREGIRNNQIMLLSKIKKLAGADRANILIKKGIRDSRRARSRRHPLGDVRPRPLAPSSLTPHAQSSGEHQAENTVAVLDEQDASSAQHDTELSELSRIFSIVPHNRILVHELLLDSDFKIEVSPQSDVRSALNREVCESMRRGIEQGQGEVWTVAVAENIQKRLLKLLQPGNSMHQILSEVLDTDHVRNQCRQGQFSYERFFSFMADLLPRLCAPIRDVEVQALAQALKSSADSADAMIEKLFGLLHTIDVMSLDYTNYMLQQAAPTLIREGPGYEQRMFAQDLAANNHSLQRTKRWWRNASVNVLTEISIGDPAGRPNFAKTYARGLIDLAIGTAPLQEAEVPETLHLDTSRLSRIRSDMLSFVTIGGILLTAKNLLRRDVRSQWKPEAKRILHSLKVGYANPSHDLTARVLAVIESGHGMPASSREHLSSVITRFLAEASSGHLSDPVLKLLFQRLKTHVFNRLAATGSVERVRVASTASEGLAGIGLSEFIAQVGAVAEELEKVAAVDRAAHGVWYAQVADEVEGLGQAMA